MDKLIFQNLQRWARDIIRFVPIKSSFILHGNIHDIFPFPDQDTEDAQKIRYIPYPLEAYLIEVLKADGYTGFIAYDSIDSCFVLQDKAEQEYFKQLVRLNFKDKDDGIIAETPLPKAIDTIRSLTKAKDRFLAVFIRYASRLTLKPESPEEAENEFFSKALKLSHEAHPHKPDEESVTRMNPIFWLCEKINDLPSWLSIDNPKIRVINIPKPDAQNRKRIISAIAPSSHGFESIQDELTRNRLIEAFVDQTDGMLLNDLLAVCRLSKREEVEFKNINEAVRRYKLGVTEDPWRKVSRERIKNGEKILAKRVKGQPQAIIKAVDILKRAVTGLAGIQHAKISNKPKGVLFFAGPTGVGKTELAKALTELIFGDENSYIRFDMSEFSQAHSDQRLLGAPPGYVGYEAGGELTKAVREKPFSVILFDEIEKAHPRILDKFLQILEDGRITDGRGETVYFSETIIIFTSNLGMESVAIVGENTSKGEIPPVPPYKKLKTKLLSAIEKYFKEQLERPEILNRIGDNIVVFDYIRQDVAEQIFDKIWDNLTQRLKESNNIILEIKPEASKRLKQFCIEDLSNGGRGIGNHFENYCINPLSRALFDRQEKDDKKKESKTITISQLDMHDEVPGIILE